MTLTMDGRWDGTRCRVQGTATQDAQGRGWTFDTAITVNGERVPPDFSKRSGSAPAKPVRRLLSAVRSAVLLHLDPHQLAEPSYSADPAPRVEFDGANLGATLADVALTDPSGFHELRSRVHAVVPALESLALDRASIEKVEYAAVEDKAGLFKRVHATYQGFRVRMGFRGIGQVAAYAASEGTLITLGLLTVLSRHPVPHLVMIDELERGLHPKALGELVRQIRALMERFPDLQVIGTTHSPYLVDYFQPSEVRLTTMADDGSVIAGMLSDHPDFERWQDEMKPGEFWSAVGEDWLRERKAPASE